jgi:post-segregation antitoxin (ccd killing protein)
MSSWGEFSWVAGSSCAYNAHVKSMNGACTVSAFETTAKKPVNLSLSEALVQESRAYCGNLSAKVEEMLQAYVLSERLARQQHREQAQRAVAEWNALHDASGSYADGHSTL